VRAWDSSTVPEFGDELWRDQRAPAGNFFSQATFPARKSEGKWRGGAGEYGGEKGRRLLALGEKGERATGHEGGCREGGTVGEDKSDRWDPVVSE
jgi:hypothetical protein